MLDFMDVMERARLCAVSKKKTSCSRESFSYQGLQTPRSKLRPAMPALEPEFPAANTEALLSMRFFIGLEKQQFLIVGTSKSDACLCARPDC